MDTDNHIQADEKQVDYLHWGLDNDLYSIDTGIIPMFKKNSD